MGEIIFSFSINGSNTNGVVFELHNVNNVLKIFLKQYQFGIPVGNGFEFLFSDLHFFMLTPLEDVGLYTFQKFKINGRYFSSYKIIKNFQEYLRFQHYEPLPEDYIDIPVKRYTSRLRKLMKQLVNLKEIREHPSTRRFEQDIIESIILNRFEQIKNSFVCEACLGLGGKHTCVIEIDSNSLKVDKLSKLATELLIGVEKCGDNCPQVFKQDIEYANQLFNLTLRHPKTEEIKILLYQFMTTEKVEEIKTYKVYKTVKFFFE